MINTIERKHQEKQISVKQEEDTYISYSSAQVKYTQRHSGRRESCLNGAASPRSKCGEGSLAFQTNTLRWRSIEGDDESQLKSRPQSRTPLRGHAVRYRACARVLNRQCLNRLLPEQTFAPWLSIVWLSPQQKFAQAKPEQTFAALGDFVWRRLFFHRVHRYVALKLAFAIEIDWGSLP